jgi:hypothetical protein
MESIRCLLPLVALATAPAQEPASILPVREVTVFKDGHAFVLREGAATADQGGRVVLDGLPAPVLGTFWPYASGSARLVSATAAKERVSRDRTALDLREWLLANAGSLVRIVDRDGRTIEGELIGIPERSAAELERDDPAGTPRLPERGSIVLVRSHPSIVSLPLDRIRDVTASDGKRTFTEETLRDRLTLRLEREAGGPAVGAATVGLVYVQRGLRWIPSYKVEIDGAGGAKAKLSATLVNDLIDLDDATVHLVIGVPRFEFAGMVDPIALQETAAEAGTRVAPAQQSRFSNFLSNAIMTQTAAIAEAPSEPAPEVVGGEANEDLFVFTVRHVTLRRGERMVLPVTELALAYKDVYVLDVAPTPPVDARLDLQGERMAELAKLLAAPKCKHVLRLSNDAAVPLTTAPALVLRQGRVLAQGLVTYTPAGTESDLDINTAIDVLVEVDERETKRQPNAMQHDGTSYSRVDLAGTIELRSRKPQAIDVEVTRRVLGLGDDAGSTGELVQLGLAETFGGAPRPPFSGYWSWPWWWWQWNGVARFRWKLRLEPGQQVELPATWHYFWR